MKPKSSWFLRLSTIFLVEKKFFHDSAEKCYKTLSNYCQMSQSLFYKFKLGSPCYSYKFKLELLFHKGIKNVSFTWRGYHELQLRGQDTGLLTMSISTHSLWWARFDTFSLISSISSLVSVHLVIVYICATYI